MVKNYDSGLVDGEKFHCRCVEKGSPEKPYTITLVLHQRHNEADYTR